MRRPALVFIHGVRSSSALWDDQLRAARAAGYEAVAVDLPGHGARREDRFTLESAFSVVDEAVDSVGGGTGPVVLVGLSLGGYVTLEYAARRPERLAGVIASACTCDPKGKPVRLYGTLAHHTVSAVGAVSGVVTGAVSGVAARWAPRMPRLRTAHARTGGPALRLDGSPVPFRPGWGVVTDMLGQLAGRSSIANLRQITVPIWFVNGQRDHMRLEEKKYLAAVPTSRLVVVPRAGHDVSAEAPQAFNRILLDAVGDIERGRAPSPAGVQHAVRPHAGMGFAAGV